LDTIEEKLNNGDFKNLALLESYFKRMIANAKDYYPRSSTVFDDAERIRKALSNFMTKRNPAYNIRGYQAMPTPIPPDDGEEDEEDEDADGEDADGDEDEDEAEEDDEDDDEDIRGGSKRRSIILKRTGSGRPSRNSTSLAQDSPRASLAAAKPDHQYEGVPYKGLSFQEAQEKVVEEALRHQTPEYVPSILTSLDFR
jgi:hypothetical protein